MILQLCDICTHHGHDLLRFGCLSGLSCFSFTLTPFFALPSCLSCCVPLVLSCDVLVTEQAAPPDAQAASVEGSWLGPASVCGCWASHTACCCCCSGGGGGGGGKTGGGCPRLAFLCVACCSACSAVAVHCVWLQHKLLLLEAMS